MYNKSFDSLTLNIWLEQNREFLKGARIQKIQQPTRREIVLSLRNTGLTKKLYININPKYYHVSFMSKETEEKRLIEIPQKPPMFCMLLRKYL
ncbi:MAG: NFACT family protein, partial [Cyanobacteria bacterium RUI128]|nr:NFACT family protein [Cyanobacteria bacterium RUI128]